MTFYRRKYGEEQPYWPLGKYKLRLPFIHYRLEIPELIQGLVIFTIGLSMVEIMTSVVGMSFLSALTTVILTQFLMLIPSTLGVPFVSGFITPLLPILIVFLGEFEPGVEAIQALIAVQLLTAVIFLILGITGLGTKFVLLLPSSLKGGILIGAGIGAIMVEIQEGGRLAETPISIIIGSVLCLYIMFSNSFKKISEKYPIFKFIANYGIMPAVIVAIIVGWAVGEYSSPKIEWGITLPSISAIAEISPLVIGFPNKSLFVKAIPIAILAYVIAYGDIIVADRLVSRTKKIRKDEKIEYSLGQVHTLTSIRNFLHALFAPHPGLAGPIFTAGTASVTERYTFGRKAMDSIYSGTNTLVISLCLAMFVTPLISLFQPFLPIALSITLILTGYLCITLGVQQLKTETEIGVAGITAIVLTVYGAAHGLIVGLILYFVVQKQTLFKKREMEVLKTNF